MNIKQLNDMMILKLFHFFRVFSDQFSIYFTIDNTLIAEQINVIVVVIIITINGVRWTIIIWRISFYLFVVQKALEIIKI